MHESDLFCLFSCHCFSFRHFVEVFLEVYFLLFRSTLPQKRPSAYEKCNSLLVSRVYSICWAVSSAGWQILSLFPTCLSSYLILCLFNTLPCAGLQIIRPLMGSGYVHELTPKTFFNPGLFIFLQSPFYPPVITLAFAMSLLQHTVCRGKKVSYKQLRYCCNVRKTGCHWQGVCEFEIQKKGDYIYLNFLYLYLRIRH